MMAIAPHIGAANVTVSPLILLLELVSVSPSRLTCHRHLHLEGLSRSHTWRYDHIHQTTWSLDLYSLTSCHSLRYCHCDHLGLLLLLGILLHLHLLLMELQHIILHLILHGTWSSCNSTCSTRLLRDNWLHHDE